MKYGVFIALLVSLLAREIGMPSHLQAQGTYTCKYITQNLCVPDSACESGFKPPTPNICGAHNFDKNGCLAVAAQNCVMNATDWTGWCNGWGVSTGLGCLDVSNPKHFLEQLLSWVVGIGGGIGLLMIVISGFNLMAAGGDPKKIQGAKENISAAIMGIIFLSMCVLILNVIGVNVLGLSTLGFSV